MCGDPAFPFLYEHNCLIHPELHKAYDAAAFAGSPLPRLLESAKLYHETFDVIKKLFPEQFKHGNALDMYSPEYPYYYQAHLYSWALPCFETIQSILNYCPKDTPILEVGSGPGLYSSILSHYRTVYPTDVTIERPFAPIRYMKPLVIPSKQSVSDNPHTFILSVFPYPDMIADILSLSKIGQTICMVIPPIAGISCSCILHILDQCEVLDRIYMWEGMFDGEPPYHPRWAGIIFRKTKTWDYSGNYKNDKLMASVLSEGKLKVYDDYDSVLKNRETIMANYFK